MSSNACQTAAREASTTVLTRMRATPSVWAHGPGCVTPPLHDVDMRCNQLSQCSDSLLHCHDVSLGHADGTTSCLSGPACDVPHAGHLWQLPCDAVDPSCGCGRALVAVDELLDDDDEVLAA